MERISSLDRDWTFANLCQPNGLDV